MASRVSDLADRFLEAGWARSVDPALLIASKVKLTCRTQVRGGHLVDKAEPVVKLEDGCAITSGEMLKSDLALQNHAEGSTFALLKRRGTAMSRLKVETLSIRTSADIKQLLRMAAERERRSVASMIEILVLEYARAHELTNEWHRSDTTKKEADMEIPFADQTANAANPTLMDGATS